METSIQKPLTLLHLYGGAMIIGGHYRSGLAMAKGLTEKGHRVIVLAPDAAPEMADAFREAGAEIHYLPILATVGKFPSIAGWKEIAGIAERFGVDVIHSMDFISVPRGYRAAIKTGKPFFCTEPGFNSVSHFPPRKAQVVLFSDEQLGIYRDIYHLSGDNLKIIRARIETDFYHPVSVPPAFFSHWGLDNDGLAFGIVTRLQPSKQHKIRALIDVVKKYGNIDKKLNIYIVGDGTCREELQAEADRIGNPSASIHFLGPIYAPHQVNFFYNACDVIIGSGRGLMEAMACKKPVIIPGESGQAELLGPDNIKRIAHYNFSGRHFRMHPNTTELAEVIHDISTHPDILSPTAAFCYDYVQKHLSARVGAAELIEWYNKSETANHNRIDFGLWYLEACYWKFRTRLKHTAQRIKQI